MGIVFAKAVKYDAKLRMAIAGPSGSGKTWTALSIAKAMGGKCALLDTEHGSAAKYADVFDFDTLALEPPFHPDRFAEAIQAAEAAGYGLLIIDSLSHAWMGQGGLLEIVDNIAARSKSQNSFIAWKQGTPIQLRLVEAILASKIHIIATMREKTEYVVDKEGGGKSSPRKVGLAPIQRDGMEFEFDVLGEMNQENDLAITKTRCPGLTGKVFNKPTGVEIAEILVSWLKGAPAPEKKPAVEAGEGDKQGAGKKAADVPQRPYAPEIVKRELAKRAVKGGSALCPQGERGALVGLLDELLHDHTGGRRHMFLEYATGDMSSKALTEGWADAIRYWLGVDKLSQGAPNETAVKELLAIVVQGEKDAGQQSLPADDTPGRENNV